METVIMQRNALFLDYRDASSAMRELLKDERVVKESVYRRNEPQGIRVWWREETPTAYKPPAV